MNAKRPIRSRFSRRGRAVIPIARWSSTATASPSALAHGVPPVRRHATVPQAWMPRIGNSRRTGPAGQGMDEVFVTIQGRRHYPHRYPRPVAARLPGCHTLFPQAVEGPGASAWAVGHRQAEQLQGGAPNGHAVCRPSHGPIREQSRRSLPPAHTTTRATNATLQISRSGTTILVRARTRPQPFPRWPSPGASGASSRAPRSLFPHLGCSHNRRLTRVEITIPSTGSLDER